MIEKRFVHKNESIIDTQTDELVNASSEEGAKIITAWLNELFDDCNDLKKENYGNLDGINYYQEQNGHLESRISNLECENEQLKNKIDVLEDDNETYHKSLETLNLYTKRFIPTKCTNEFKDCKTNRYYWLDHEGNFEGCLELLNLLDCENELLTSENRQLKGRLMAYEEQIKGDVE